ncbi:MAG: hypothetical protein JWM24_806, partial [Solirubrobacterales bacterium]|nr:hypothetical protein [Solirubrobacterales bacterium]
MQSQLVADPRTNRLGRTLPPTSAQSKAKSAEIAA